MKENKIIAEGIFKNNLYILMENNKNKHFNAQYSLFIYGLDD